MKRIIFLTILSLAAAGRVPRHAELTQEQVNDVIRRSRRALQGAQPAAVRLTFHDCVGE